MYKQEVAAFVVNNLGVISMTTNNSPGGVAFDFFDIWEQIRDTGYTSVVMIHSHPPGHNRMSLTDKNMVYGWVQALGVPIIYVIATREENTFHFCKRDPNDKNKVFREIVDVEMNEDMKTVIESILHLSYVETPETIIDEIKKELIVNHKTPFFETIEYTDKVLSEEWKRFWVSWLQKTKDFRPLTHPPNKQIIGWWCKGYDSEDNAILYAVVEGMDEEDVRQAVLKDWPERNNWRRFEKVARNYTPSERFPISKFWMKKRFDAKR